MQPRSVPPRSRTALETLGPATLYYELASGDERDSVLRYFRLKLKRDEAEHHWRAVLERQRERVRKLDRPVDIRSTAFEYFLEEGLLHDPIVVEEEALKKAESLAYRDRLTGVYNYAYFEEQLRTEVARALRHRTPLALIMLDLDGFKAVNDRLGHGAGNRVLRDIGWMLRKDARQGDVVARLGGDEFAVLLYRTDGRTAAAIAERKRAAIASWFAGGAACADPAGVEGTDITASLGIAEIEGPDTTAVTLFESADRALYHAKRSGRNRVSVAPAKGTGTVFCP